jgi:hypothetical protein
MATNNDGHLLASDGNVAIDFVWGNMPMQPNDVRPTVNHLDPALDNHIIALSGWNGYPQFIPGSTGADVLGQTDYVLVPLVLGLTTALGKDALEDASLVVTTATAATNTAGNITRINATSATAANVYATSANTFYPVGTKISIAAGTPAGSNPVNVPAAFIGSWTVTASAAGYVTIAGSGFSVADTTGINATGTLTGTSGTVKATTIAAGAATILPGAAVTITPWA